VAVYQRASKLGVTWREVPGEASEISRPLDSLIFGVGELLYKIDDGPPKLRVWNPHESFGEVEPVGRGKIV
jgi:hypothetical protein